MAGNQEQVIVLTRWAQKWLRFGWDIVLNGTPTEQIAKKILNHLDTELLEPEMYVEEHILERRKLVRTKIDRKSVHSVASEFTEHQVAEDNAVTTANTEVGVNKKHTMRQDSTHLEEDHMVKSMLARSITKRLAKRQRSNFAAAIAKVAYNKFGERPMSSANILVTRKWLQKYLEDGFKDLRTCDKNLAIDRALFLSFVPTKDFLRMRIVMETAEAEKRMSGKSLLSRIFRVVSGDEAK